MKQPYAAVDKSPVLSYEEIETSMDENLDDPAMPLESTANLLQRFQGKDLVFQGQ